MNHHHSDREDDQPRTALAEAFREAEEAAARADGRSQDGQERSGEAGDATSPNPAAQEQARQER
ncbi:hypothetical protein [Streptomyces sp. NPDC005012]|uniref:hypothetical protein n=1 Tax=Streptomyces sp. NPDC005012 TaxID=3154558 RepID=UPI0033B7A176